MTSAIDPCKAMGKAIRTQRLKLGLTQEKLAERCHLHWTYISDVERGRRNITVGSLLAIARALNVPAARLLKNL